MLMPNMGKVVTITGSNAQCMAQATEVPIPKASQFNFIFIFCGRAKIVYLQ